jgi:PhnB protein
MKEIVRYLNFDGNCRQAMTFYQKCLGGDLHMTTFGEFKAPGIPEGTGHRIMHARLTSGPAAALMASDTMPGMPNQKGTNVSVSVHCDTSEEIDRLYAAFAQSGKSTMPLQDVPWGARFGMLTDEFGIQWMFNFDKPKS